MPSYTMHYSAVQDCVFKNFREDFEAENDKDAVKQAEKRWRSYCYGKKPGLVSFSSLEEVRTIKWRPKKLEGGNPDKKQK